MQHAKFNNGIYIYRGSYQAQNKIRTKLNKYKYNIHSSENYITVEEKT